MIELDSTSIRHFKLSSGDEVIALVQGKTKENMLIVECPMRVIVTLNDRGFKFVFTTWQPMAKDDICFINPLHIISYVECSNDIKEQYIRMCIGSVDNESDDHEHITDDHEEPPDESHDSLSAKGSETVH